MKKILVCFFFAILGLSSYAQDANGFATYNYYRMGPPAGVTVPPIPSIACFNCNGKGVIICSSCNGSGVINCPDCSGSGFGSGNCSVCNGRGYNTSGNQMLYCSVCKGTGKQLCNRCGGSGSLGKCPDCKGQGGGYCPYCKGTGKE